MALAGGIVLLAPMATPYSPLYRRVFRWCRPLVMRAALWSLAGAPIAALGAEELEIMDLGRRQKFEVAENEALLSKWGTTKGELTTQLATNLPSVALLESYGAQLLVQLPTPIDRARAAAGADDRIKALPGADWKPVIYVKGANRTTANRRVITREVDVRLPDGQTAEDVRARANAEGFRPSKAKGHVLLQFSNPWKAVEAAAALRADGTNAEVVLGRVLERRAVPNDPYFDFQWHLRNIGQETSLAGVDVNILSAWDITKGADVKVVVVDDSMQTQLTDAQPQSGHEDLVENARPVSSGLHFDFRDGDSNPNPVDADDAHGTAVSGVLAARGNNSIGVSGSAPEADLVAVRLIGSFVTDQDIADALTWSPATYTAEISNNSWGYTGAPGLRDVGLTITSSLEDAALNGRGGKGQITLFANGNARLEEDDGNYTTLASSRFVIAVGAIDNLGRQSFYSTSGANLLISAPSNGGTLGIFTTDVSGNRGYNPGFEEPDDLDYTSSFGGTSSATPLTSGCVALMLSANPDLGWRDVHEILAQTARKIAPNDSDWQDNGAGFHFNHKFGAGIVDATAAVILARDWENLGPETSVVKSLSAPAVPVAVPDNNLTGVSRDLDFSDVENVRVERVEAKIKISTSNRSDLEVSLVSPSGKRSILSPFHARNPFVNDANFDTGDGQGWPFTTTHHWGENSQGTWKVQVRDLRSSTTATLQAARITIYGTSAPTQRLRFAQHRSTAIENLGTAMIQVERLGDPVGTVSVDWAVSNASYNGNAVQDVDYTATPGTLTFAEGETVKEIPITLINNETEDGARSLYVVLKNPQGAKLGGFALTKLDLIDDESSLVTVAQGDIEMLESGNSPNTPNPGTFVVTRSKATNQPLTVNYSIGGSATSEEDFEPLSGTVVILENETSAVVTINPLDDLDLEGLETVVLTIESGDGYGVGVPASAQLNLIDNDRPVVNVEAIDNSAKEAGLETGTVRVRRNHPLTGNPLALAEPMVVNLSVGGSAVPNENYEPIPSSVVIPANEDHALITVIPIDDAVYKTSQTVVIRLAAGFEYGNGFLDQAAVEIVNNEPLPDRNAPTVTITDPKQGAKINSPGTVMARGTAADNQQVAKVQYQVNDSPFLLANGTTSWEIDITSLVSPGPNVLRIRALDQFDNVSTVAVNEFSYISSRTLTVAVEGSGKVSKGFTPSSSRDAGFQYTITATPSRGFVFAGWNGLGVSSPLKTYTFTMPDENGTLTARFISDPFGPAIAGSYEGLLRSQGQFSPTAAGFLKIKVGSLGSFSGSIIYNGAKVPLKGQFTADQPAAGSGRYVGEIKRKKGLAPLKVDLRIDTEGDDNRIAGTIGTLDETSIVSADRAAFSKKSNPYLPAASKPQLFTLRFPGPVPINNAVPIGEGFATASIDANGTVKWTGQLRDGTKASQTTKLSKTLTFPLFATLFKGDGVILGNVVLDSSQTDSDLTGSLDWFKDSRQDKIFQNGYTDTDATVLGSIYVPPTSGGLVLPGLGAATVQFRNGNMNISGLDVTIQVQPKNKVTITGNNAQAMSMKISAAKGSFSGTFKHPVTGVKTPYGGVFLQKTQTGAGGFVGSVLTTLPIQTGTVTVVPTAP